MSLHDEIKARAKLVAKDVKAGKASAYTSQARDFMGEVPDAVLGVIDLVHREANRKKPNDALIHAYIYLFATGLEGIRYQVDQGHDWAEELVDVVREQLLVLARGGVIAPHILMLLLNGFIEAKLAPGDDLIELLGGIALEAAVDEPEPALSEVGDLFESIVEESGGNEFEVHAALDDISKALPPKFRIFALHQISTSDNPVLRDTMILYLLDTAPEVRRTVCELIAEHASPSLVSPVALRRMVALRNWLPENERHHLDAAIKKSRQRKIDCAPWPAKHVEEIIATNIDGAGAQSVFAVTKEGRKYLIASLLVKLGAGVADAWCLRDQSKSDVKDFLVHIHSDTDSHRVGPEFLNFLVPHYLAVGQKNGNVPVAGLLDFVEAIGVETWQPAELSVDDLLALLEHDIDPSLIDKKAVSEVIERSDGWLDDFGFMESWFEQDAEVDAILSKSPRSRTSTKVNITIKLVLEPRRAKWTERFLWTALWLKQKQDLLSPWTDFFIVGRELQRGRPIKDIPVMRGIAEVTVMAQAPWV